MGRSSQTASNIKLPSGSLQPTTIFDPTTRKATPVPGLLGDESTFDEYTLSAYGDISLSNVYFVPGLPSDISLRNMDSAESESESRKRNPLSEVQPARLAERRRPSVIQNILPASPTKAVTTYTDDFEKLVENRLPPGLVKATAGYCPPMNALAPRPRHATKLRVIEKSRDVRKSRMGSPPAAREPAAPLPSAPIAITRPKPKEGPLRGYARLPPRPPIPRWDLLGPDVCGKIIGGMQEI